MSTHARQSREGRRIDLFDVDVVAAAHQMFEEPDGKIQFVAHFSFLEFDPFSPPKKGALHRLVFFSYSRNRSSS